MMSAAPEISVVMITCDRVGQLANALDTLERQQLRDGWGYEIIVIDDGSKDATSALLAKHALTSPVPLRYFSSEGLGVPAARNLAAKHAQGRWLASFDDDQLASLGWLEALRSAADQTGASCFGGALSLLLPAPTKLADIGPRARILLGEHLLSDKLSPYPAGETPATNNALITRELFERVGGFDPNFRQGGSDTDFFERVKALGEPIWFVPQAAALHVIPAARISSGYYRWVARKVAASRVRILRKRSDTTTLVRLLALRSFAILLRDLPQLALAKLRRNNREAVDARCSIWFSSSLFRALWAQRSASAESNAAFLRSLDFRRHGGERDSPHT
ncbi:MAG: glycosyltransferase family A protein [Acidobacteriaceae bacterium]|nr:glycosyltransferase family A protein [Acidobacteriaceae bacterium]